MRARVATAEPSGRCRTQRTGSNGIRTDFVSVVMIVDFFMMVKIDAPRLSGYHYTFAGIMH